MTQELNGRGSSFLDRVIIRYSEEMRERKDLGNNNNKKTIMFGNVKGFSTIRIKEKNSVK